MGGVGGGGGGGGRGWPGVAREMVERMDRDVREYAELCRQERKNVLEGEGEGGGRGGRGREEVLEELLGNIRRVMGVERGLLSERIKKLLELANGKGEKRERREKEAIAANLRGICEDKVVFSLEMLIEILLAENPLTVLCSLNKELGEGEGGEGRAERVREQTVMVCLVASRLALLGRSLVLGGVALESVRRGGDEGEIKVQTDRLVEELVTERHYLVSFLNFYLFICLLCFIFYFFFFLLFI